MSSNDAILIINRVNSFEILMAIKKGTIQLNQQYGTIEWTPLIHIIVSNFDLKRKRALILLLLKNKANINQIIIDSDGDEVYPLFCAINYYLGALSDAALSDAALSDAALSDAALSDAALSDAALSDAALSKPAAAGQDRHMLNIISLLLENEADKNIVLYDGNSINTIIIIITPLHI